MPQEYRSPTMNFILTVLILTVSVPLVHIYFALFIWEDGVNKLNSILHQEIEILNLQDNPDAMQFVTELVHTIYSFIYSASGLEASTQEKGWFSDYVINHWDGVQALLLSTQLIALRTAVLALSIPLFLLIIFIAIADGVAAWIIRRSGGDRESAFIYHRTKRGFWFGMLAMLVIYYMPPVVMDPRYVLPPFILFSALAIRMTIKYFKKYI
jgi:integrating conjugative element membrane protein (TIGR03747 family)